MVANLTQVTFFINKISILAVDAQPEWTVFKNACFLVPDLMDTWFVCTKVEK